MAGSPEVTGKWKQKKTFKGEKRSKKTTKTARWKETPSIRIHWTYKRRLSSENIDGETGGGTFNRLFQKEVTLLLWNEEQAGKFCPESACTAGKHRKGWCKGRLRI